MKSLTATAEHIHTLRSSHFCHHLKDHTDLNSLRSPVDRSFAGDLTHRKKGQFICDVPKSTLNKQLFPESQVVETSHLHVTQSTCIPLGTLKGKPFQPWFYNWTVLNYLKGRCEILSNTIGQSHLQLTNVSEGICSNISKNYNETVQALKVSSFDLLEMT